MYAATPDEFADQVHRRIRLLRIAEWLVHPDRERERRWRYLRWPIFLIAFLPALIYAQALPHLIERAVTPIIPRLPWTTDRELLARVEDYFQLLHAVLAELGKWSLARGKVEYWLEELDEQIDMLEVVRERGSEIDETIAAVRAHHARQESA